MIKLIQIHFKILLFYLIIIYEINSDFFNYSFPMYRHLVILIIILKQTKIYFKVLNLILHSYNHIFYQALYKLNPTIYPILMLF